MSSLSPPPKHTTPLGRQASGGRRLYRHSIQTAFNQQHHHHDHHHHHHHLPAATGLWVAPCQPASQSASQPVISLSVAKQAHAHKHIVEKESHHVLGLAGVVTAQEGASETHASAATEQGQSRIGTEQNGRAPDYYADAHLECTHAQRSADGLVQYLSLTVVIRLPSSTADAAPRGFCPGPARKTHIDLALGFVALKTIGGVQSNPTTRTQTGFPDCTNSTEGGGGGGSGARRSAAAGAE
jgi:hypothetical protein